jgi:hypothetical protein
LAIRPACLVLQSDGVMSNKIREHPIDRLLRWLKRWWDDHSTWIRRK